MPRGKVSGIMGVDTLAGKDNRDNTVETMIVSLGSSKHMIFTHHEIDFYQVNSSASGIKQKNN